MEYCGGMNLKDLINKYKDKNELIEENILYNLLKQICLAIKEIKKKNIIHRDLKPQNIFLNKKMEIKIGDFGISKQFNSNKEYTLTINQKGSPAYIAPEIFKDGKYNKKCDIYSLGCIMYELFTLNIYFIDKISDSIKKIDTNKYNYKWQEVIDSLLQVDYNKRLDIDQNC